MHELDGKVALITGGTRGLGLEMARAFAGAGADVMVASRSAESCARAADELRGRGRRAIGHPCHVGRWAEVDELAAAAYEAFGRVDVLVNNAGMSPLYGSVEEVTEELWDKVIAVNLRGAFRLTSLVGSRMARDGGGSIINVSSTASVRPTPDVLPYAAAKAGLNALTEGFAHAFGPSVRVNAIVPGPFLTDISKAWDMDAFERRAQAFPLRRGGRPEEITGAALYLASEASSFTTGAILRVDGGAALA